MSKEKILALREDEKDPEREKEPKPNHFVYAAFVLGGLAFPLPTYAIVTCIDYYQVRYPTSTIMVDLMGVRMACMIVGYFINNALVETFTLTQRILSTYVILVSALVFLVVFDVGLQLFGDDVGFYVTLVVNAIESSMLATQQSSYYGYATMLPQRYIQAVTVGEAICGILACNMRFISKATMSDLKRSTILFYSICVIVVAICSIVFLITRRTKFVKYYLRQYQPDLSDHGNISTSYQAVATEQVFQDMPKHRSKDQAADNTDDGMLKAHPVRNDQALIHEAIDGAIELSRHRPTGSVTSLSYGVVDDTEYVVNDNSRLISKSDRSSVPWLANDTSLKASIKVRLQRRWAIILRVYKPMLILGLTLTISMSVFAVAVPSIISCTLGTWMPIIIIMLYDVGDLMARILVSVEVVRKAVTRVLVIGSISRVVFYPLVLMCCLPRPHPIISGEAWSFLIITAMGFTNGLFLVTSLSIAPSYVAESERELCGNTIMMAAIVMVLVGIGFSYVLEDVFSLTRTGDVCGTAWSNMTSTAFPSVNGTVADR